jgi:demethylmenaquinone methyltransferase/2-methoxy-6-polyprenyl-1,4-benzoquinol methylase
MTKSTKALFNSIAGRYDLLNNIISLNRHKSIKRSVIKSVPLEKGMKVLDLCTGTGDIAIGISDLFKEEIDITAVDFSENMLEIAKQRTKGQNITNSQPKGCHFASTRRVLPAQVGSIGNPLGLKSYDNIHFVQADMRNLPFENASFDAVFISFGLRHVKDIESVVLEIKRVLKPGGWFANLDVGKPKGIYNTLFRLYFFNIVPLLGEIFGAGFSNYKYLPESAEEFPSQEGLVQLFTRAGFNEVKNRDYLFGALASQVARKPA